MTEFSPTEAETLARFDAAPDAPESFHERLWDAIAGVRDASDRVPGDADTWDIVDAVRAVLKGEL